MAGLFKRRKTPNESVRASRRREGNEHALSLSPSLSSLSTSYYKVQYRFSLAKVRGWGEGIRKSVSRKVSPSPSLKKFPLLHNFSKVRFVIISRGNFREVQVRIRKFGHEKELISAKVPAGPGRVRRRARGEGSVATRRKGKGIFLSEESARRDGGVQVLLPLARG